MQLATQATAATQPLRAADYELDVSEAWAEATDPEGERGESATALFDVRSCEDSIYSDCGHGTYSERIVYFSAAEMFALRVETADGVTMLDRNAAIAALSQRSVLAMAAGASDKLNDYDGW